MINFTTPAKDEQWNSVEQLKVRESGLSFPPAPTVDPNSREQLPAGGGRFAVNPHLSTVGLINQAIRSYYYAFDPALKKSRQDAVACRADFVVQQAIREAQTPIAQLAWNITPDDETNPKEMEAAKKVSDALRLTPNLQQVFMGLLEGLWFGRAGIQFTYEWNATRPDLMTVKDWSPIQGDSLVARWSNQEWGLLVNYDYDGYTEPYNLGQAHFFTPEEMETVVIHQSERDPPDWFDTTGAGAIKGSGWRKYIFWAWYIRANLLAIVLDLIDRIGSGVWIAKYDQSNPTGRTDMEAAVAAYKSKRVISIPQDKDGRSAYALDIMEPGSTSHAIIKDMILYLDTAMRAVILGHPLGANTSISIGGDPTAIFGDSISRTTKYHANNLAETISRKWIPILYKYIAPNITPGKFAFICDHPNADQVLKYAQVLAGLGYGVNLDELALLCGVPKGMSGDQIATNMQSLNPVPIQQGQPPSNVPVATNQQG